jgi:hypothetical protein
VDIDDRLLRTEFGGRSALLTLAAEERKTGEAAAVDVTGGAIAAGALFDKVGGGDLHFCRVRAGRLSPRMLMLNIGWLNVPPFPCGVAPPAQLRGDAEALVARVAGLRVRAASLRNASALDAAEAALAAPAAAASPATVAAQPGP